MTAILLISQFIAAFQEVCDLGQYRLWMTSGLTGIWLQSRLLRWKARATMLGQGQESLRARGKLSTKLLPLCILSKETEWSGRLQSFLQGSSFGSSPIGMRIHLLACRDMMLERLQAVYEGGDVIPIPFLRAGDANPTALLNDARLSYPNAPAILPPMVSQTRLALQWLLFNFLYIIFSQELQDGQVEPNL